MPRSTDLPDDLKALVRRQALPITDISFDGVCQRLTREIKLGLEKAAAEELQRQEKERSEAKQRQREEKKWQEAEQRKQKPSARVVFVVSVLVLTVGLIWFAGSTLIYGGGRAPLVRPTPESMSALTYFLARGNEDSLNNANEQAIIDYTEAIKLAPHNGQAYYSRGAVYEELGKHAQAQADFDKAKQLGYRP